MASATTVAATVAHDYFPAFHRYFNDRGMRVDRIGRPAFLSHHKRCGYPAFHGWDDDCMFWRRDRDWETVVAEAMMC